MPEIDRAFALKADAFMPLLEALTNTAKTLNTKILVLKTKLVQLKKTKKHGAPCVDAEMKKSSTGHGYAAESHKNSATKLKRSFLTKIEIFFEICFLNQ